MNFRVLTKWTSIDQLLTSKVKTCINKWQSVGDVWNWHLTRDLEVSGCKLARCSMVTMSTKPTKRYKYPTKIEGKGILLSFHHSILKKFFPLISLTNLSVTIDFEWKSQVLFQVYEVKQEVRLSNQSQVGATFWFAYNILN